MVILLIVTKHFHRIFSGNKIIFVMCGEFKTDHTIVSRWFNRYF